MFERGEAPLLPTPPSLHPSPREGGQGDRFLNNHLLNPLPIRLSYYTTLSDDGSDVAVGGDIKDEGEEKEEGLTPLLDAPLYQSIGESLRGVQPLSSIISPFPSPIPKGRGSGG